MKRLLQPCLVLLSAAIFSPTSVASAISSDQPAAIITYPQIVVDSVNGVDTFLQITNSDSSAVDAKCFLENHNRLQCDDNGNICLTDLDCPSSFCRAGFAADEFTIRLTARQPFGWQASAGAVSLPHPDNQGSIPAVPEDPFRGTLRCVATDPDGAPIDRNVLKGTSTIERFAAGTPAELDVAHYNAVGLQAIPGANNGDNELVLGGAQAEYEGCPATILVNHFLDFAIEPMTYSSEILTDLIIVPCSGDLFHEEPGRSIAQFLVFNEFEQRYSTSRTVKVRQDGQISLIDTNDPTRSIFAAGVAGTLTAQTRLSGIGDGVIAVAVERHESLGMPGGTVASAAFNLHSQGARSEADRLFVGPPPLCGLAPATGCRTARSTSLTLIDRDRRDRLAWRFQKGEPTSKAEFGSPSSTTDYGFCLYAGSPPALVSEVEVPVSASNWRALSRGQRYDDRLAAEDGIDRIILRGSAGNRTRLFVRGSGENLELPDLPTSLPLKVQLTNSETGVCWEAEYQSSDVVENSSEKFRAKK